MDPDSIGERLLGFDMREPWNGLGGLWDSTRREAFLLRLDAPSPLSVDALVWPSVFDTGQGIGLARDERERLHLAGVPSPAHTGANAGLWEDAATMTRYLERHSMPGQPGVVIAVSWCSTDAAWVSGRFGPYPAKTSPAMRDPQWRRLGFDVADGSMVSGLSNCGYLESEAPSLRVAWAPHLNEHHLFDDAQQAFRFQSLADVRVPEHAPFFVYGLCLVSAL